MYVFIEMYEKYMKASQTLFLLISHGLKRSETKNSIYLCHHHTMIFNIRLDTASDLSLATQDLFAFATDQMDRLFV